MTIEAKKDSLTISAQAAAASIAAATPGLIIYAQVATQAISAETLQTTMEAEA